MRSSALWQVVEIGMWTTSYINVIYFRYSNMWYFFHIEDNANGLLNCFPTGQFIQIWKKLVWRISKALCVDRASLVPKMVTESACYAGYLGSVPGSGSPAEGNDYPLQYSCLQNSTDRGGPQKSELLKFRKIYWVTENKNYLNICFQYQETKNVLI